MTESSVGTWEHITPEIAKSMLERVGKQRAVVRGHVITLARALTEGEWPSRHPAPIVFDSSGALIDGQHRLLAIIESGVGTELLVVRGINPEVWDTIDVGRQREARDVLSVDYSGIDARSLAAAARWVWRYRRGLMTTGGSTAKPSPHALRVVVEENPRLVSIADRMSQELRSLFGPGVLIFVMWLLEEQDETGASRFFAAIETGDTPRFTGSRELRERLIRVSGPRSHALPPLEKIAITIKAWNTELLARPIKQLRWRTSEEFPIVGTANRPRALAS